MRAIYKYAYILYVHSLHAMRPIHKYAYILYIAYMERGLFTSMPIVYMCIAYSYMQWGLFTSMPTC